MRAPDPAAAAGVRGRRRRCPIDPGNVRPGPVREDLRRDGRGGGLRRGRRRGRRHRPEPRARHAPALALAEAGRWPVVRRAAGAWSGRRRRRDHGGPRTRRPERVGREPSTPTRSSCPGEGARRADRGLPRPAWKVLHLPAAAGAGRPTSAGDPRHRRRPPSTSPPAPRLLLDTAGGPHPGGTGRRADQAVAAAVARELPVVLAGGLEPGTWRGAAAVPGHRRGRCLGRGGAPDGPASGPARTPWRSPSSSSAPARRGSIGRTSPPVRRPSTPGLLEADAAGRWGMDRAFGGRYVPETLVAALARARGGLRRPPRRPPSSGRSCGRCSRRMPAGRRPLPRGSPGRRPSWAGAAPWTRRRPCRPGSGST